MSRLLSPVRIVAASNAPAQWKQQAWKICDGTADQVEINSALALGGVELSPGIFNLAATLAMDGDGTATSSNIMLRGQGCETTILAAATGVTGITITNCAKVNISDILITLGGAADGIKSTGKSSSPYWSCFESEFRNIQVKSFNGHTGWAFNLESPFRSKFSNLTGWGIANGMWLKSHSPSFNPGNCTFEVMHMDLSVTNGIGYKVHAVDGGGFMNMLSFIECDAIDSTGTSTTSIGWLFQGSTTTYWAPRNCKVFHSNPEMFNTSVKLAHAENIDVTLTYADTPTGGIIFDCSADSIMNWLRSEYTYIPSGRTTKILNDANTNTTMPNVLRDSAGYNDGTMTITTTSATKVMNCGRNGSGTFPAAFTW